MRLTNRLSMTLRIGVFAVAILAPATPLSAQTSDDLLNDQAVQTLSLTVHSTDWENLHSNVFSNDYYPCDLVWNGIRMRNVGIRSRGLGSRFGPKPGFELSFDRYAARQRFLGLQSVVLDNLVTDPSMLRERVAMAFLRHMGLPASRETHARLFVNGEFVGLYAIVEPVDTTFVEKTFGTGGTLFEYRWTYAYFATFLGETLEPYRTLFEPRNETIQSTFDLYSPIRDLFRVINDAPDATFATDVNKHLDLDGAIRLVAADALLAEWDGFLGYDGMNNVYLARVGQRGRLVSWDKDHTFQAAAYPILAGTNENALMRRVLNNPGLRATFFNELSNAASLAASNNWLVNEVNRQHAQIRAAALADGFKPYSNTEFDQAVAELISIARTRPGFVLSESARLR